MTPVYPDPFGTLLAPTKNNFASVGAALEYYEARALKAREAQAMLARGAELARQVCDHSEAAVQELEKLTPEQRALLGLSEMDLSLRESMEPLAHSLAPMVFTFLAAAGEYAKRAELLEQTVAALRAAL